MTFVAGSAGSVGRKLRRYREQLQLTTADVSSQTGIPDNRLRELEAGSLAPSGDEILHPGGLLQMRLSVLCL